jgi:hypothetical protein
MPQYLRINIKNLYPDTPPRDLPFQEGIEQN